jgi:hypothetical protein
VFVLGCPRSGASAVSGALQRNAGFGFGSNGAMTPTLLDFATLMAERRKQKSAISTTEAAQSGTASTVDGRPDEDGTRGKYSLRLRSAFAGKGGSPWLEKAHGVAALQCLPLIAQAFPEAKFIYMHRRLNETLASHSGSTVSYPDIAETWVQCFDVWRVHKNLLRGRMVEIDQRDLHFHPYRTIDRLRLFLGLNSDAAAKTAADLANADHDLSQSSSPVRWEDIDIPPDDALRIRRQSAPTMEAYGYEYDEIYHVTDGPSIMLAHTRNLSGLEARGDAVLLRLPALEVDAAGRVALGDVRTGDRILAVVTREERYCGRLFFRMRLMHGDIELDARVFDLAATQGGEIDYALPAAENLMLEVSLVASRPLNRDVEIRLRALRIVQSQERASRAVTGVV